MLGFREWGGGLQEAAKGWLAMEELVAVGRTGCAVVSLTCGEGMDVRECVRGLRCGPMTNAWADTALAPQVLKCAGQMLYRSERIPF